MLSKMCCLASALAAVDVHPAFAGMVRILAEMEGQFLTRVLLSASISCQEAFRTVTISYRRTGVRAVEVDAPGNWAIIFTMLPAITSSTAAFVLEIRNDPVLLLGDLADLGNGVDDFASRGNIFRTVLAIL